MARDISTVEVAITVDLKDRCGITRCTNVPVGSITQWGKKFTFNELDFGSDRANAMFDSMFDKYFGHVIYPAVQAWRFLEPRTRVNINISITWTRPYPKTISKYYTGEYITMIMNMPTFRQPHHAYYVARALFSGTPIKDVSANLAQCCNRLYTPVGDYEYVKQVYDEAKTLGRRLAYGLRAQKNYPVDFSKLIMPRGVLINALYPRLLGNTFLQELYSRSPEMIGDKFVENGIEQY